MESSFAYCTQKIPKILSEKPPRITKYEEVICDIFTQSEGKLLKKTLLSYSSVDRSLFVFKTVQVCATKERI